MRSEHLMHAGSRWDTIDTIVFDLFHTLVDPQAHAPPGYRRLAAVAAILGLPSSDLDLWWESRVGEFVSSPVSPIDELVELARTRRIVMSPGNVADIDRAMGSFQDAALKQPVAGAVEALQTLSRAGIKTSILSNAHSRDVRVFGDSPLAQVVDDACFSCFTGMVKPAPEAYLGALHRVGGEAEHAAFVGDGAGREFSGARDAGFRLIVCVAGPARRGGWRAGEAQEQIEATADLVVEDVADLPALVPGCHS